jgi:hypothetical protein
MEGKNDLRTAYESETGEHFFNNIPAYADWLEDMLSGMDAIAFGVFLTGHDRATIEQMYSDWAKIKQA